MDELLEPRASVAEGSQAAVSTKPLQVESSRRDLELRRRLRVALRELAACRVLLDSHSIEYDKSSFSCNLKDHEDVLVEENEAADDLGLLVRTSSIQQDTLTQSLTDCSSSVGPFSPPLRASTTQLESTNEVVESLPTLAAVSTAGSMVDSGAPVAPFQAASTTVGESVGDVGNALEIATGHLRDKERLEVELSMAKALLMLNNVNVNLDFDQEDASIGSAADVVKLKGSRHLIQLLLTLKQKVSLLNQQYLLLRGDMLYMNHEMNVCRHWILQSFRMAMQHQSQEHSSLQTRFERLSKVLT